MNITEFRNKYETPTYLGDGVYARFDGFHVWLSTLSNPHDIALDPDTFKALVTYQQQIYIDAKAAWEGKP